MNNTSAIAKQVLRESMRTKVDKMMVLLSWIVFGAFMVFFVWKMRKEMDKENKHQEDLLKIKKEIRRRRW